MKDSIIIPLDLVKTTPNDQELGEIVRTIYLEILKNNKDESTKD
jgi:hypothetical protein